MLQAVRDMQLLLETLIDPCDFVACLTIIGNAASPVHCEVQCARYSHGRSTDIRRVPKLLSTFAHFGLKWRFGRLLRSMGSRSKIPRRGTPT